MTNPKLNFVGSAEIEEVKILRLKYICQTIPSDTGIEPKMLYTLQICKNTLHPDTDEIQNVLGRLSFMPIGKGILIAALLGKVLNVVSAYAPQVRCEEEKDKEEFWRDMNEVMQGIPS